MSNRIDAQHVNDGYYTYRTCDMGQYTAANAMTSAGLLWQARLAEASLVLRHLRCEVVRIHHSGYLWKDARDGAGEAAVRCGGDAHAAELARRGSVAAPRRDCGSAPEKLGECEFLAYSQHPLPPGWEVRWIKSENARQWHTG